MKGLSFFLLPDLTVMQSRTYSSCYATTRGSDKAMTNTVEFHAAASIYAVRE